MTDRIFDRPFIAVQSSRLSTITGGTRLVPNDGGAVPSAGSLPSLHLPTPSFGTSPKQTKCPPWRAWQVEKNIGILTDGSPAMVPTLHCPKYRQPYK